MPMDRIETVEAIVRKIVSEAPGEGQVAAYIYLYDGIVQACAKRGGTVPESV